MKRLIVFLIAAAMCMSGCTQAAAPALVETKTINMGGLFFVDQASGKLMMYDGNAEKHETNGEGPVSSFAKTDEGVYYVNDNSLNVYWFSEEESEKLAEGRFSSLAAGDEYIFFFEDDEYGDHIGLCAMSIRDFAIKRMELSGVSSLSAHSNTAYFTMLSDDYTELSLYKWSPNDDEIKLLYPNCRYDSLNMSNGSLIFDCNEGRMVYDCETEEFAAFIYSLEYTDSIVYYDENFLIASGGLDNDMQNINIISRGAVVKNIPLHDQTNVSVIDENNDMLLLQMKKAVPHIEGAPVSSEGSYEKNYALFDKNSLSITYPADMQQ